MTFNEVVLPAVLSGNFEEAVAQWKKHSLESAFSIDEAIQSWSVCAQTLEARLIYLSIATHNPLLDEALKKYRTWLQDQKTVIIEWSAIGAKPLVLPDNMRVGHIEIDQDHETLFKMANDVRNALRENDTQESTRAAECLIDEILAHFKREEIVLTKEGYPLTDDHAFYHNLLCEQAGPLREVVVDLAGGGKASMITFDSLISFLVNDTVADDMEFKPFFAKSVDAHQRNRKTA